MNYDWKFIIILYQNYIWIAVTGKIASRQDYNHNLNQYYPKIVNLKDKKMSYQNYISKIILNCGCNPGKIASGQDNDSKYKI